MKVGTHKKSVLLLWAVLLASTSFGVYKNFTAIDTHTVHEKEIIQLRLNDTNGIENFVKNFAKAYYSWDTSKEAIEARTTEISKYLTKELQDLNADTIRTDIPTSVTVTNVLVWNVEQSESWCLSEAPPTKAGQISYVSRLSWYAFSFLLVLSLFFLSS